MINATQMMTHYLRLPILFFIITTTLYGQPDWIQIKSNAVFNVADANYDDPEILSINNGGWEDGLYITRDGKHLFSTYLPLDVISWLSDWEPCIDSGPYYRGPFLGIDTITNIWGCPNYMHSDIVKSHWLDNDESFTPWYSSNMSKPMTFEGGVCGVLHNPDTFELFVFTLDEGDNGMDIYLKRNTSTNPDFSDAVSILSTQAHEDNPHIEKLENGNLVLFFDRDRYIYYSISTDNGYNWSEPILVTNVLNDQAPYDIQPHLWHDGEDWWVYFCADAENGYRSIYKSKQTITNDWNSWGPKELVISPLGINNGYGNAIGVGEPTLTEWGDLYFVTVYGNTLQSDTTDVFDCDPWVLKRKTNTASINKPASLSGDVLIHPNPAANQITIQLPVDYRMNAIEFVNLLGEIQLVVPGNLTHYEQIDIPAIPDGIYFLNIRTQNTSLRSKVTICR